MLDHFQHQHYTWIVVINEKIGSRVATIGIAEILFKPLSGATTYPNIGLLADILPHAGTITLTDTAVPEITAILVLTAAKSQAITAPCHYGLLELYPTRIQGLGYLL